MRLVLLYPYTHFTEEETEPREVSYPGHVVRAKSGSESPRCTVSSPHVPSCGGTLPRDSQENISLRDRQGPMAFSHGL